MLKMEVCRGIGVSVARGAVGLSVGHGRVVDASRTGPVAANVLRHRLWPAPRGTGHSWCQVISGLVGKHLAEVIGVVLRADVL